MVKNYSIFFIAILVLCLIFTPVVKGGYYYTSENLKEDSSERINRVQGANSSSSQELKVTSDMDSTTSQFYELDAEHQKFYRRVFQALQKYLRDNFYTNKFEKTTLFVKSDQCAGIKIPAQDKNQGIQNSLLHVYWKLDTKDEHQNKYIPELCQSHNERVNVVVFRIHYTQRYSFNEEQLHSDKFFEATFRIFLHHFINIMGFSTPQWKQFNLMDKNTKFIQNKLHYIEPEFLADVRNHFKCQNIEGVPLEDKSNISRSPANLDNTLFQNDIMSNSFDAYNVVISSFVASFFNGNHNYDINHNNFRAEPYDWGKNQGCDFFIHNKGNPGFEEFKQSNDITCSFDFDGIGYARKDDEGHKFVLGDAKQQCSSEGQYQPYSFFSKLGFSYGKNSRCLESNVVNMKQIDQAQVHMKQRCHNVVCRLQDDDITIDSVAVIVDGTPYRCDLSSKQCNVQSATHIGTVKLPDSDRSLQRLCKKSKSCVNSCSKNGYCQNGECHCFAGFAGVDCSQRCKYYYDTNKKQCFGSETDKLCPDQNQVMIYGSRTCVWQDKKCFGQLFSYQGNCFDNCPEGTKALDAAKQCKKCYVENCKTCPEIEKCAKCINGKILVNGKCQSECPAGTFYSPSALICQGCSDNCLKCSNGIDCEICASGLYRKNSQCVKQCGDNYYLEDDKITCRPCNSKCSNGCIRNADNCRECEGTRPYQLKGYCVQICPDGYFLGNDGYTCVACNESCKTCDGPFANNCLSCQDFSEGNRNFLFEEKGICIQSCKMFSGLATKGQVCVSCADNCHTCVGDKPDVCQRCQSGYYIKGNGQCVKDCGENFYSHQQRCMPCPSKCKTCKSYDYCTSCQDGKYFFEEKNFCYEKGGIKPEGYFFNESLQLLQKCEVTNCKWCSKKDSCDTCADGFQVNSNYDGCEYKSCAKQHFMDTDSKVCTQCNKKCAECEYHANNCTECNADAFVLIEGQQIKDCVWQCTDGYYPQQYTYFQNKVCTPCNKKTQGCKTCNYDGTCNRCDQVSGIQFILNSQHQCVPPKGCGVGYYTSNEDNTCQKCHDYCKDCSGPSNDQCSACKDGYLNHKSSSCVKVCPQGYTLNLATKNSCILCSYPCETCNATGGCATCKEGLMPRNGTCQQGCSENQFYNLANNDCMPCPNGCKTCLNQQQCIFCQSGFTYNKGQCISKCKEGQYQIQTNYYNYCEYCPYGCANCRDAFTCTKCQDGYDFGIQNKCQPKQTHCKDGQYLDRTNGKCQPCTEGCLKCNGPQKYQCSLCDQNNGFLLENGRFCVQKQCSEGFFNHQNECKKCPFPCKNCSSMDKCTECSHGLLQNNYCVAKCAGDLIQNDSTQKCVQCSPACKTCYGPEDNQCKVCANNKYLHDRQCLGRCPTQYFANSTYSCQKCSERCMTCETTFYNCTSCAKGFFSLTSTTGEMKCLYGYCPARYYKSANNECLACPDKCLKCDGQKCLVCDGGLQANNNTCETSCSNGYYLASDKSKCLTCNITCATCSKGDACDSCYRGYKLVGTKCQMGCNDKHYLDRTTMECKQCMDHCDQCYNNDTCSACSSDFFLQGKTQCLKACDLKSGYYQTFIQNRGVCLPCMSSCQTCDNNNTCKTCREGFYFKEKQCMKSCPNGLYGDNNSQSCQQCEPICATCKDSSTCTTCSGTLLLRNKTCVKECDSDEYSYYKRCYSCSDNCAACQNKNQCTLCKPPYLKQDGFCVKSCSKYYYEDSSQSNGVTTKYCTKCNNGCLTCTAKTTCYSCLPGFFLHPYKKQCLSYTEASKINFFYPSQQHKKLIPCESGCKNCTENKCMECDDVYYVQKGNKCECKAGFVSVVVGNQLVCEQACKFGTYQNQNSCDACPVLCQTCVSKTSCSSCSDSNLMTLVSGLCKCKDGYFQFRDKCVQECPNGLIGKNGKCVTCTISNCQQCNDDGTKCKACNANYQLHNGSCLDLCPAKYFSHKNQCLKCNDKCTECSSHNSCSGCVSGLFLHKEICFTGCPYYFYYADKLNNRCEKCNDHCQQCVNPNECKMCQQGYFLSNGQCLEECPDKQYGNYLTRKCYNCSKQCETCSKKSTNCTTCSSTAISFQNQCYVNCPAGYYKDGTTCTACQSPCSVCQDSATKCIRCDQGYYSHYEQNRLQCLDQCQAGFFGVEYNGYKYCKQCYKGCETCESPSRQHCTSCRKGYFLIDGYCMSNCPAKYFGDVTDNNCKSCDDKCTYCIQSATTCLKCVQGFYYHEKSCKETCPMGTFGKDGQCMKCHKNCSMCTGPGHDNCEECNEGHAYLVQDSTICLTQCPKGTFLIKASRTCNHCAEGCYTCIEANKCQSCQDGYYWQDDNTCAKGCDSGYFADTTSQKCKKCHGSCAECYDSSENGCKSCTGTLIFVQNKCTDKCLDGYFKNSANLCEICDETCATCETDSQKCKTCPQNFYLYESNCLRECKVGMYPHYKSGECRDCGYKCLSCNVDGYCETCDSGHKLMQGECIQESQNVTCQDGQYLNQNSCAQCPSNCSKCKPQQSSSGAITPYCYVCKANFQLLETEGNCFDQGAVVDGYYYDKSTNKYYQCQDTCTKCTGKYECTECKSGYPFYKKQCINECPLETYYHQTDSAIECKLCEGACLSCYGPGEDKCNSCKGDYYWYSYKCVSNCPDGTIASFNQDKNTAQCIECTGGCKTCIETPDSCLTCKEGFVQQGYQCQTACAEGHFDSNGTCQACDTPCSQCFGSDNIECTACNEGYYLHGETCSNTCPDGYYAEKGTNLCIQCDLNKCKTCAHNAENCLTCSETYYKLDGNCLEGCPLGFFAETNSGECHKCIEGCNSCSGPAMADCDECLGNFLYNPVIETCSLECNNGYYAVQTLNACVECDQNCSSCDNKHYCTQCKSEFYLQLYPANNQASCVKQCDDGYFANQDEGHCQQCPDNCAICNNPYKCFKCTGSLVLVDYTCQTGCASGYYISSDKKCEECQSGCSECDNAEQCLTCNEGYYSFNGKCTLSCPEKYYADSNSRQCEQCADKCVECNSKQCLTCDYDYVWQDGQCVDKCDDGLYTSYFNLKEEQGNYGYCRTCSRECKTCEYEPGMCTSCNAEQVLEDYTCVDKVCIAGQFLKDKSAGTCGTCHTYCTECYGANENQCTACSDDFVLKGNECVIVCDEGQFISERQIATNNSVLLYCEKCPYTCSICQGKDQCLECREGFYMLDNQCYQHCDYGYHSDAASQTCQECFDSNCMKCNQSIDICTSCASGFYLYENQCVDSCPVDFFYADPTTGLCSKCQDNCAQCSFNECLQCQQDFEPVQSSDGTITCMCKIGYAYINGECSNVAPKGYYISGRDLKECPTQCKTCLNEQQCTSCSGDLFLYQEQYDCATSCPTKMFAGEGNVCRACQKGCSVCSNAQSCETCDSGLFLQPETKQCVSKCKNSLEANLATGKCESCFTIDNCSKCQHDGQYCQVCKDNFFRTQDGKQCLDQCPAGYGGVVYQSRNFSISYCKACASNCKTCDKTNLEKCTSCKEGLFFNEAQGECLKRCQFGYFANKEESICQPCHESCRSCSGPKKTECYACAQGLYKVKDVCVDYCPENQIKTANQGCQACTKPCLTCKDTVSKCTSCAYGFLLQNDNTCEQCDSKCATCEKQTTNCTKCNIFYYQQVDGTNSCKKTCPDGYYGNNSLRKCLKCAANCATCSKNPRNCGTCAPGFTNAPKCVIEKPNCEEGTYVSVSYTQNQVNYSCDKCAENCLSCTNLKTCDKCAEGYVNTEKRVYPRFTCKKQAECEAGKFSYYDYKQKEFLCSDCRSGCSECKLRNIYVKSSYLCTKCGDGFEPFKGNLKKCVKSQPECDNGQYTIQIQSQYQCVDCPAGCETCAAKNINNPRTLSCDTCSEGYFQSANKRRCIPDCKENQFKGPNGCITCHTTCATCEKRGSKNCTTCIEGYEKDDNNKCVKKKVEVPKCLGRAYYNYKLKSCACYDKSLIYNADKGCLTESEYQDLFDCQINEFFDSGLSKCVACRSNNDELLCKRCDGVDVENCQQCVAGYYLDKSDYSCKACPSNCAKCSNADSCDICEQGSFRSYIKKAGTVRYTCQASSCSTGTIPYVDSLFYLNSDLFTSEEKMSFYREVRLSQMFGNDSSNANSGSVSVALNVNLQPIFDVNELLWTYGDNGKPYYEDQLITLECLPCYKHCSSCVDGLILHENNCIRQCPTNFKEENGACVDISASTDVELLGIKHLTQNSAGFQPYSKPLILESQIKGTADSYSWSIVNVYDIETQVEQEYLEEEFVALLARANTERRILKLSANFQTISPGFIYVFQVKLNDDNAKAAQVKVIIPAEKEDDATNGQENSLEKLGISEDLIQVEPTNGVAAETQFSVQYTYNSDIILSQSGWIFQVLYGKKEIPLSSENVKGTITFVTPQINEDVQDVQITIRARNKNEVFQTVRYITVTKNANYNINDSEQIQKINETSTSGSSQNNVSLNEILQALSQVAQKVESSDFDKDTVKNFLTFLKRVVNIISQLTIDQSNIESIIKALHIINEMKYSDKDTQKIMIVFVQKVAEKIQDNITMERFTKCLKKLIDIINSENVEGLESSERKEINYSIQKALATAFEKWGSSASNSNPKVVLETENMTGVSETFDAEIDDIEGGITSSIETNENDEQGTDITIPKAALNGSTKVNLVQAVTKKGTTQQDGAQNDISNSVDIQLVDTETSGKIEVNDLDESNPIKFVLSTEDKTPITNTTTTGQDGQQYKKEQRVQFWDEDNNTFDNKGVKFNVTEVKDAQGNVTGQQFNCETTHLTSFTAQIVDVLAQIFNRKVKPRIYIYGGNSTILGFTLMLLFATLLSLI